MGPATVVLNGNNKSTNHKIIAAMLNKYQHSQVVVMDNPSSNRILLHHKVLWEWSRALLVLFKR